MKKTTIQVNSGTLERLKSFKKHQRESYEEVLNSILDEVENDELTEEDIQDIIQTLKLGISMQGAW